MTEETMASHEEGKRSKDIPDKVCLYVCHITCIKSGTVLTYSKMHPGGVVCTPLGNGCTYLVFGLHLICTPGEVKNAPHTKVRCTPFTELY